MTREEIQEFVRRENELLEMSWNMDRPPYRFRYYAEADVVMLDIYDKWMKLRKTHAIDYHITEERFRIKVNEAVDLFMTLHPDWTDIRRLSNGQLAWGSGR